MDAAARGRRVARDGAVDQQTSYGPFLIPGVGDAAAIEQAELLDRRCSWSSSSGVGIEDTAAA